MQFLIGAVIVGVIAWKYFGNASEGGAGAAAKIQIFEPQVSAQILRDLTLYTFEVVTTEEEAKRGMSRVKLTLAGSPTDQMDQMSRAFWWAVGMNTTGYAILGPVGMPTEASFLRDSGGKFPLGSWSPNSAQLLAIPAKEAEQIASMAKIGSPWAVIVRVANKLQKFTFGLASTDDIKAEDVV